MRFITRGREPAHGLHALTGMQAIPVNLKRVDTVAPDLKVDLERARLLANWLDAKFSFMGIRFGLDSLVGLIPVVGDSLTAIASLYPIWVAERHGLGKAIQARMAFNVLVDWLPGMLPIVGDVIDVAYKANLKNVKLLEAAAAKRLRRGEFSQRPGRP
jgi:hypothetical protein